MERMHDRMAEHAKGSSGMGGHMNGAGTGGMSGPMGGMRQGNGSTNT